MADLYGTNPKTSSLESEEMSSFLHNLLQGTSITSPSSFASFKPKLSPPSSPPRQPQQPPPPESSSAAVLWRSRSATFGPDSVGRVRGGASTAGSSSVMMDAVSGHNFSDPGCFFPAGAKGSTSNAFSSAGVVDSDAITSLMKNNKFPAENHITDLNFSCERGLEASEMPVIQVPQRSGKRTRAAEVHNLSEKRRRSRINEKLKALQNLIPNSNKTDKASMLDEAIEYLKQLQLQVQMLSVRNGLSLHPVYMPGSLQTLQLPETGVSFDEANGLMNTNRTADPLCRNQEMLALPAFDISNQCNPSNQPIGRPTTINASNLGSTFGSESVMQNQKSAGKMQNHTSN